MVSMQGERQGLGVGSLVVGNKAFLVKCCAVIRFEYVYYGNGFDAKPANRNQVAAKGILAVLD